MNRNNRLVLVAILCGWLSLAATDGMNPQVLLDMANRWRQKQTFEQGLEVTGGSVVMPTANLGEYTVATLPAAAAANENFYTTVTDGSTTTDCTVGGGANRVLCRSTGAAWEAAGGGGGGATPGGDTNAIQINLGGALGGTSGFWTPATGFWVLGPTGTTIFQVDPTGAITVGGSLSTAPSDGNNYFGLSNNTTRDPTPGANEIYVEGNVWKLNQNGNEFPITQDTDGIYDQLCGAWLSGVTTEILAGTSVYTTVSFTGTLAEAYIKSGVSGSISISVWKCSFANHPPTAADATASATPFMLSANTKSKDVSLISGVTQFNKGDSVIFYVNSCEALPNAQIVLVGKR